MANISMNDFSEFAIKPLSKKLNVDKHLLISIKKYFDNILKYFNPNIHPSSITFISNLPAGKSFWNSSVFNSFGA